MAITAGADIEASDMNLLMPVGTVLPFAGSSAPTGFLMCDGSAVSRTTYASLFAVIGVDYGAGDGSTTFNIPDMRGSVAIGSGEKSYDLIQVISYTGVDTGTSIVTTANQHHFYNGLQLTISNSANPITFKTDHDNAAVRSDGSIDISGPIQSALEPGDKVICTAQSSTNFVVSTTYYVHSVGYNGALGGRYMFLTDTPGGSIFGSGNSGTASFDIYLRPFLDVGTGACYVASSDQLTMGDISENGLEVGDVLYGANSISITGVSLNNFYYVVDVDTVAQRFKVSSTAGGSPIAVSGAGWIQFDGARRRTAFAFVLSPTTFRLSRSAQNTYDGDTYITIAEAGTGNHTFDGGTHTLTDRNVGEFGGEENNVLTLGQLPRHSHLQTRNTDTTGSGLVGVGTEDGDSYTPDDTTGISNAGSNEPYNVMQPFVVLNYIIHHKAYA